MLACINLLCMKVLYERHSDMSPACLIVYRSATSVILLFAYHNTNIKHILYDSVDRGSVPPLISRMISGNFGIFIIVMAAKYFPLTVVAMVVNCAPFVSLFLAGPILGEKITVSQLVTVLIAFSGLALMILGGKEEAQRPAYTPTPMIYFAVFCHPFFVSATTLAMRAARKLNESVIATYMSVSLLVVFLPICLATGQDLSVWKRFSVVDWLCLLEVGAGTVTAQTLLFSALKNHTVSGLEPYNFLQPL